MSDRNNYQLFQNISLRLKRINLSKYNRFFIDFLIPPPVFFAVAYFIFNKFLKLNFIIDDIDFLSCLQSLADAKESLFKFIHIKAMRGISFKPMSLGIDWVINFKLFGLNPYGYHLFNIILLAINSFVLYLLIAKCFELRLLGFVISFCYLVHPFNMEGIGWISGGFTSQNVVLFSCLTLIIYDLYLKKPKKILLNLSYLSFACAFLSREDVIMLPFVMVFFLLFFTHLNKARIQEMLGYLATSMFILAVRYWLLYPNVFSYYQWDFLNIPNALLVNKYYLNLALSPLKNLFGQVSFLKNYKILLTLFKLALYLLFIPFIIYKLYKYRKTKEVKLLGFGLAWYCLFSLPFIFMVGDVFRQDRYLSLSIIGVLMAQAAVMMIILRALLSNNISIKFLLVCFSFVMLLICNYMTVEGFSNDNWSKYNLNTLAYIETINMAIKTNPGIKNIKLEGFPEVERLSVLFRLYPDFKNINFTDIANEEKGEKDREDTLTIKHRES